MGERGVVWMHKYIPDRLDKRELQMNGRSRRTVYTASKLEGEKYKHAET
jgi:hypothetical protein